MKKEKMNIIDNVKLDDIKTFTQADDAVVMVLKDGQEVRFEVMKDAFDRFHFYNMINEIRATKQEQSILHFTDVLGFVNIGLNHLKLNEIRHITDEAGVDVDPSEIKSIMLDGIKRKNLLAKAEQEGNLKKYVLIALDKHLEQIGKGGEVHE